MRGWLKENDVVCEVDGMMMMTIQHDDDEEHGEDDNDDAVC